MYLLSERAGDRPTPSRTSTFECNLVGIGGGLAIGEASTLNKTLNELFLSTNALDAGLPTEIDRWLGIIRALYTKLLAVMMSMHARLWVGSCLRSR